MSAVPELRGWAQLEDWGFQVPDDLPAGNGVGLVLNFRMGDLHYVASRPKGTGNGFKLGAPWRHLD